MKCHNCGTENPDEAAYCRSCGVPVQPPFGVVPPVPGQTIRYCAACGRAIDWHASSCRFCGKDYRSPMVPAYAVPAVPEKTLKPVVGGVLVLVAGLLAIAMGVGFVGFIEASDIENDLRLERYDVTPEELIDFVRTCGVIAIVFGAIAIIGGILAITRKHFYLGIVGGVFALLGFGIVIGSILGLIGLILIAISKDEFQQPRIPPP